MINEPEINVSDPMGHFFYLFRSLEIIPKACTDHSDTQLVFIFIKNLSKFK